MVEASTGEQLRQRILETTTHLIVNYGYDGISMREIAEAVGISKAGLYYHFADKEDLLLAVLTESVKHLEHALAEARRHTTIRAQITALIAALFVQIPTQRSLIRLSMQQLPRISERTRITIEQTYYDHFFAPIESMLREAIVRNELRAVDPHMTTWLLLGLIYPFFQNTHPYAIIATSDAVNTIITMFFDGVGVHS